MKDFYSIQNIKKVRWGVLEEIQPCVIGTKIATQVLKDNDFVEVDADNGTIKKI